MKLVITILLFITGIACAQLQESTIPNVDQRSRILSDTNELPFFDDFSNTPGSVPLTSNWINSGASVTRGYAINPPSFNALTFDGLNNTGQPYTFVGGANENISIDIDGETDAIESKALNLSSLTSRDNVAISFFWQKGGASQNTLPDLEDGDSLRLFFLDQNNNWVKVWPFDTTTIATMDTLTSGKAFNFEFVRVENPLFFHSGFKFKFTTFGKVTGAWDVWNIDHIYLDKNRVTDNVQDFALSSFKAPLFGDYYSIPTEALVNNNFTLNTSATVKVFNLSNVNNFIGSSSLTITHPDSKTTLSSTSQSGDLIQARDSKEITLDINQTTFTEAIVRIAQDDSISLLTKITLVTPDDSIPSNDTLEQITTLSNYYAYDDGSPEMAIGLGEYGEFVMSFTIDRTDTLTALDFAFIKIGHDLTNTPVSIRVWKSLNGIGRSNISERLASLFTGVKYSDDNSFTRYELNEAIILTPGTFYIGYESSTLNPIYVGFDKNTDFIKEKGYLRRGQDDWSQNEIINISGTPMIHPVFDKTTAARLQKETTEEEVKTSLNLSLYPNPTTDNIHLIGHIISYKIVNSMGTVIKIGVTNIEDKLNHIELNSLTNGLYQLSATDGRLDESIRFVISR